MAKLDIIIPHYHEDAATMKPMIDILRLQRNINWTDFRVVYVLDGDDITIPEGLFDDCPFNVVEVKVPHGGVSAARNAGLDFSNADWVMFCDSDDSFLSTVSLQAYMEYMTDDKVLVTSAFFEEAPSRKDGHMLLVRHDGGDYIFVHGKAFRRSWLNENNVRFNNDLVLHEDAYFVAMARHLAGKKNSAHINAPMYLWHYNKSSVTRSHANFVLQTYGELCRKNTALTEEFLRRGMYVQAKGIVCRTITDAYCMLNRKSWNRPEWKEYLQDAEDCVALFLNHYYYIYKGAGERVIQVGLDDLRNRLIKENDFDTEAVIPFEEWIERLRK